MGSGGVGGIRAELSNPIAGAGEGCEGAVGMGNVWSWQRPGPTVVSVGAHVERLRGRTISGGWEDWQEESRYEDSERQRLHCWNYFLRVEERQARFRPDGLQRRVARRSCDLEILGRSRDLIRSGHFSPGEPNLFRPLVDSWLNWDEYFALADYASYVEAQSRAGADYLDREKWIQKSINMAGAGYFRRTGDSGVL